MTILLCDILHSLQVQADFTLCLQCFFIYIKTLLLFLERRLTNGHQNGLYSFICPEMIQLKLKFECHQITIYIFLFFLSLNIFENPLL